MNSNQQTMIRILAGDTGCEVRSSAANTRKVYRAGYIKFAADHEFNPAFPITFEALADFIATTAEQTSTETAKSYVGHLHSHHIDHGYNADVFSDDRIKWSQPHL